MGRVGVLNFGFEDDPDLTMVVHLFKVNLDEVEDNGGTVNYSCEEITPEWFYYSDVPYSGMFADDSIWFPKVMGWEGEEWRGKGYFVFENGGSEVNRVKEWKMDKGG